MLSQQPLKGAKPHQKQKVLPGSKQKDQIFRSGFLALRNLNRRPVALERRHGSFR